MVDGIRVHTADETHFVGELADVWDDLAEFHPGLAILFEAKLAGRDGKCPLPGCHPCKALPFSNRIREVFTAPVDEHRLRVKELILARSTALEEVDDALGFWLVVRHRWDSTDPLEGRRSIGVLSHQATECSDADSARGVTEKCTAVQCILSGKQVVHV